MAKAKKKQSKLVKIAKAVGAALLALALVAGGVKGVTYYREGLPKYAEGDCLLDKTNMLAAIVTGIDRDKGLYNLTVFLLGVFPVEATAPIRSFNKITTIQKVSCQTGEPIE